ncbi:hypothetical protein JIG36_41525 [Actinoplanes sp. LDG1-06]|uniref:Uncharacterized protein n=1 Tax=Paractinoplanes ovalisporus TaxID=2810368 RepID=A0ABS2AQ65_9ACTN|nr:hypothetical protein [Actinoplanes ovalisporus]MBM2622003.1 hypothetical protein [Actinoplanes ovalisporus]
MGDRRLAGRRRHRRRVGPDRDRRRRHAHGGNVYQPNGSYYQSTVSGTHRACPGGTDFDIYLQKWNGTSWAVVAQGATSAADETATYNGTADYYRWRVHAYGGSGSCSLGYSNP